MKNVFLAFLGGIVVGMLVAPDKGANTRKRLFGHLDDLADNVSDDVNDAYDEGKSRLKRASSKSKVRRAT